MRLKLDKSMLKDRRVLYGILVVVVVVISLAVATMWGGGGDGGDGNGNGDGKKDPVVADAGPDVIDDAGQIVGFNASGSTGPIAQYWWDFDSASVNGTLVHEADGKDVSHIFEEPGVYLVTLVVERKDGQNDTDTLMAFIDLNQTSQGSVSATQMSDNNTVAVKGEANRVVLTLRFKTRNSQTELIPNNVDMFVYDKSGRLIANSATQLVNPTLDDQEKTLDVPLAQIVVDGSFSVEVRYTTAGLPRTVEYSFQVQVEYHL